MRMFALGLRAHVETFGTAGVAASLPEAGSVFNGCFTRDCPAQGFCAGVEPCC